MPPEIERADSDRPTIARTRIHEIDVLRGATVLWLIAYYLLRPSEVLPAGVHAFLEHANHDELSLADVGPPGFVMFSAASLGISLLRRRRAGATIVACLLRLARRCFALCALGLLLDATLDTPPFGGHWWYLLSLIALSDFCVGLTLVLGGVAAISVLWFALLTIHGAILAIASPMLSDAVWLPDEVARHSWLLSVVAGGASTGWLIPLFLDRFPLDPARVLRPLVIGVLCANLAIVLSTFVPIRSHDWSPTYSLLCSGFAFVVLAGATLLVSFPRACYPKNLPTSEGTHWSPCAPPSPCDS